MAVGDSDEDEDDEAGTPPAVGFCQALGVCQSSPWPWKVVSFSGFSMFLFFSFSVYDVLLV